MAYTSYYVTSLSLVLMAVSMPLIIHAQSDYTPLNDPGVIVPGIDVEFLITSAGNIWSQPRLIDSIAYVCTDVLPTISVAIPDQFPSLYWEDPCKLVNEVANDLDTAKLCEGLNSTFANLTGILNSVMESTQSNISGVARRRRRDTEADLALLVEPDFVLGAILNITADIYGFEAENATLTTICTAAVEKFLVPSIPDQIAEFGSRVGVVYMPLGQYYLCDHWDDFVNEFVAGSVDEETSMLFDDLAFALAIANAVGFNGRGDMCSEMNAAAATGESAMKDLSRTVITNAFKVITDGNHCSATATSIIDVLAPVMPEIALLVSDGYTLYQYTGYKSIDDMCGQVGSSFSASIITDSTAYHVTSLSMTILTMVSIMAVIFPF